MSVTRSQVRTMLGKRVRVTWDAGRAGNGHAVATVLAAKRYKAILDCADFSVSFSASIREPGLATVLPAPFSQHGVRLDFEEGKSTCRVSMPFRHITAIEEVNDPCLTSSSYPAA